MKSRSWPLMATVAALALGACANGPGVYPAEGVRPVVSFPVTSNPTPYSECLGELRRDGVAIHRVDIVIERLATLHRIGFGTGRGLLGIEFRLPRRARETKPDLRPTRVDDELGFSP